jgi:hypothetical protein
MSLRICPFVKMAAAKFALETEGPRLNAPGIRAYGTNDDPHRDVGECLRPSHSNRLFAEDRQGRDTALPAPAGTTFGGPHRGGPPQTPCVTTHADAIEVVMRFSFAEWVTARSKSEGNPWPPGTAAVQFMVAYVAPRNAAPEFSNHQAGVAIDLCQERTRGNEIHNSTSISPVNWRDRWHRT